MSENAVVLNKVTKKFGDITALDGITASLPKGKIVGLAGPDGAGKTTLIRLMTGLLSPTEGSVEILGLDTVKEADQIPFQIGYMPQRFGLYEDLTVEQNLNLYADLKGLSKEERKKTFDQLLAFTQLAHFKTRLSGALSGGMKQKLGLACTLLKKPKLLLLDEPSVGVDPLSRRELWKMVTELLQEGITVVWSTAYLDEAEKCDTVLLLNLGKLLDERAPRELQKRVEGRTFRVENFSGSRRVFLKNALQEPDVEDGIIQGKGVRLLFREGFKQPPYDLIPVSPRYEDGFIDILGGGPGGVSLLAETMPPVSSGKDPIIVADHLTKRYGSFTAAKEITLEIKKGEIFGLLGPNGAGKTTTFKMMCGLIKPTSGKGSVNGFDLQEAPGIARSQIGYMAQKFSLYGDLSVLQNLQFFAGIYALPEKRKKQAIDEMVEVFDLKEYLETSASLLPLGFKQRLALACSLMHEPKVLFLDEPTSGVDPIARREFWNHINGIVEKGVTVMVTTHFMDEAEYCDRVALVYQSEIIQAGTPDDLKERAGAATLEEAFIQLIERHG